MFSHSQQLTIQIKHPWKIHTALSAGSRSRKYPDSRHRIARWTTYRSPLQRMVMSLPRWDVQRLFPYSQHPAQAKENAKSEKNNTRENNLLQLPQIVRVQQRRRVHAVGVELRLPLLLRHLLRRGLLRCAFLLASTLARRAGGSRSRLGLLTTGVVAGRDRVG